MYREISKLLLFSNLGDDSMLLRLGEIWREWESGNYDSYDLICRINREVKRILDLGTTYGFDTNLWDNYLTFILVTNENSFTLTAERVGAGDGTVNHFAKNDFAAFMRLFHFDFSPLENSLGIDSFSTLTKYKALVKQEKNYYRSVSRRVQDLSGKLGEVRTVDEFFDLVTGFYHTYGVGMFGLNQAFRIRTQENALEFLPINNTDKVRLKDLIGYELQKKELVANTKAFLKGLPVNDVLLYGDAGTGKSSSVKALINEYYDQGLRMVEIYKYQFRYLSNVMNRIKSRNYRFIIFIDDLSFEEDEVEYKFLKSVIEGGAEARPDNVLIYATSNRRHLVKEMWKDRDDMEFDGEVHRSDTLEEKLSLSARFGTAINYSIPSRKEYHEIVRALASKMLPKSMTDDEEGLFKLSDRFELRHGGVSGRTAQQFINYMLLGSNKI